MVGGRNCYRIQAFRHLCQSRLQSSRKTCILHPRAKNTPEPNRKQRKLQCDHQKASKIFQSSRKRPIHLRNESELPPKPSKQLWDSQLPRWARRDFIKLPVLIPRHFATSSSRHAKAYKTLTKDCQEGTPLRDQSRKALQD